MDEEVKCPVDAWQWDGKRETCPHCDFPIARFRGLLSGKRVVYDEKLKQEFDDLVAKHRKFMKPEKPKGCGKEMPFWEWQPTKRLKLPLMAKSLEKRKSNTCP
jgi:hypothetical protein